MENQASGFTLFLPLILLSVLMAIPAHFLAKDKGKNATLWTVLALIPTVNFFCMLFFIGASNSRVEEKLDALLERTQKSMQTTL